MSKPPSIPPTGIPKSAAKKRTKKAAVQPPQSVDAINHGAAHPHAHNHNLNHHHHSHPAQSESFAPAPTANPTSPPSLPLPHTPESALFNFAQGAYPAEFTFEERYYDGNGQAISPPGATGNTAQPPFSLPFPFDYKPGNGGQISSGQFNLTHEDLLHTANVLYSRMGDPNFAADDTYWASLPQHVRQFVREAIPIQAGKNASNANGRASAAEGRPEMYTMAQRIVTAASQGMGLSPGVGAGVLAAVHGRHYPESGLGEELGFHRHPDAKEEEYDLEEEEFDLDEPGFIAPNGDAPKKKNKKKKKNAASVEPPPAALPPPAVKQPPRQPVPHPPHPPTAQPNLHPPPPPITPAPAHPPPSSRAAGKQPMSNAPAATQPPARSARAAGKAPASSAPAHNANANHSHHNHPPPSKATAKGKAPVAQPPAKIWTQSSLQDRENIRQFWLSLTEAERRDLLQIEKDAVLRKMKEQHRHSCGCAVCGRKKVNIESELEQLYEQYYDELRHYAAEQRAAATGRQNPPPGAGPFPGSVEVDATGQVTKFDHRAPDPNHLAQDDLIDDASEDYDDEEYDDEDDLEDDDIGSDEADVGDDLDDPIPPSQPPSTRPSRPMPKTAAPPRPAGGDDFMGFGSSLATIKGGILTVADDLLKNDGAKFLEMMEQLAVARSAREEQNIRDLQDETEDDYDEKEEHISEAERMEEGKRMFQIFAARMFEQRVLQAYREKVAKQREEQLLRELEEEDDAKRQKEEKKAKESQKKKDKKRLQKQKAEEEKAAREAAIAAEIEAAKAKAEQAERDRQRKAEEERARREAVKKAAQEEQARIAAERKKRQQEEKEREEEAAKKKREREEKARKEREQREKEAKEKERREKEEKLVKEKAEKERLAKEKAEKDRLAKEAREKAERDRLARVEEERQDKARKEEIARKERDAAEQAKILAAQQAQRERVKAEKAAAEKAAADKLAASERTAAATASAIRPVQPVPVRAKTVSSNGTSPQVPIPVEAANLSPVKSIPIPPGVIRQPVRPAQHKTPQPYFSQPVGLPSRVPVPQAFAPGYRPSFSSPSPAAFSPPQSSNGPSSISPNPTAPRAYVPEPSPPFDLAPRTAPIGMGFPPVKAGRLPSMDEAFSPPTAPIGSLPGRTASGEISDDFRHASNPAPIGPPPGPIGRPSAFHDQPPASSSTVRSSSPSLPDKVYGSAALGADDDVVVQPSRRTISNGWDAPVAAAPGSGRWSTAPTSSIWGSSAGNDPAWAQPVARQPSFGGIGSPFGTSAQQSVGAGSVIGGLGGAPFGSLFNAAPGPGLGQSHPPHGLTAHGLLAQQQQQQSQSQQSQQPQQLPHSHLHH
ncbi:hypothetical protein DB88DRAFT_482611 [Papiliotrema laurentii]|uniref:Stress response protein NST1 n=1 Tax=Papiliotrema laurentii TaxID=5418 RepID=A0AAD9L8M2_PAPLA|nr:hypothetical protein DB88DRAFT_482611 [Papiliotrema laurentii]